MKPWAIAIGVVVGIAIAFLVRHRRAPSERTEAIVLRDLMVRDDVRVDLYLPTPGKPAPWIVFADEAPRPTRQRKHSSGVESGWPWSRWPRPTAE